MKKVSKNIIDEINVYAKCKNAVLAASLLLSAAGAIIACAAIILDGLRMWNIKFVLIFWVVYIMGLFVAIIAINHYEKKRDELVSKVNTDTLKYFFDYFMNISEPDYIYYEVKDIFMYGLWNLSESNEYLKILMFTELSEEARNEIVEKIYKKQFMAASIFRCLTFERDGIIFRNQEIYLNQGLFLEIIEKYESVYTDKGCRKKEFIQKCKKIEAEYEDYKKSAKLNYKGIPGKISFMDRWYIHISNPEFAFGLNILLFASAIIFALAQAAAHFSPVAWPNEVVEIVDYIATVIFEAITIVLLWGDIVKQRRQRKLK